SAARATCPETSRCWRNGAPVAPGCDDSQLHGGSRKLLPSPGGARNGATGCDRARGRPREVTNLVGRCANGAERHPRMAERAGEGSRPTGDPRRSGIERSAAWAVRPTRRRVLGMGAGIALTPLTAAVPKAEPSVDLAGLEAAVDALVQKAGVKSADPGL